MGLDLTKKTGDPVVTEYNGSPQDAGSPGTYSYTGVSVEGISQDVDILRRQRDDDESGLFAGLENRQMGFNLNTGTGKAVLIWKDENGVRHDYAEVDAIWEIVGGILKPIASSPTALPDGLTITGIATVTQDPTTGIDLVRLSYLQSNYYDKTTSDGKYALTGELDSKVDKDILTQQTMDGGLIMGNDSEVDGELLVYEKLDVLGKLVVLGTVDFTENLVATGDVNTFTGEMDLRGQKVTLSDGHTLIGTGTTSVNDNKAISLAGGGLASTARGGFVNVYGNDHSTEGGNVLIIPGVDGFRLEYGARTRRGHTTVQRDFDLPPIWGDNTSSTQYWTILIPQVNDSFNARLRFEFSSYDGNIIGEIMCHSYTSSLTNPQARSAVATGSNVSHTLRLGYTDGGDTLAVQIYGNLRLGLLKFSGITENIGKEYWNGVQSISTSSPSATWTDTVALTS